MFTDWEWLLAGVDRVWAPVATPLGLLLALGVTGHTLLTKRDVSACTGWIGLAWIAPVWGALFYVMFGVNRVVRRARQARAPRPPRARGTRHLARAIPAPFEALDRAARRITGRPAEGGNAVTVLSNGDEAYPAMLAAIAGAQRSVALSTFIMHRDAVGLRFAEALAEAANRGVAVRVLLDGMGSGYFPAIRRTLRGRGVPTALFMHSALPWRMPFLNLRSHKKLLVVDGAVAFTGGINIGAGNVLADHPRHAVADTHFRIEGPVAAQLADAFARDWSFTAREELDGPAWFPDLGARGDAVARVVASGPDADVEKIELVLLEALGCARATIRLMTPYFLPHETLVTALVLAALRGVEVDLVVPERSNHRFVDLAMRAHIAPLLEHGVRVWVGPEPFNHSKLLAIDGQWSLIGSANWDMRSLRLNFELDVELYDRPLARELEARIDAQKRARLRLADLNARSLPTRLRDAGLRLLLPYI